VGQGVEIQSGNEGVNKVGKREGRERSQVEENQPLRPDSHQHHLGGINKRREGLETD